MNLHRKILSMTSLQPFDEDLIEANVLDIYEQVMETYLKDRQLIPEANLVEVAYGDLDVRPHETVAKVYRDLGLDGWSEAEPRVEAYIDSQRGYRKNGFTVSDREASLIEDRWAFAFDALGYEMRRCNDVFASERSDTNDALSAQLVDLAG